ncbi:hypothetical protein [Microbacterium sp. SORGH_AS_0888]|uniref:hypothetical protein n=1 Tax=Microbacterium sp. SORGH_AS_0888 TaxID=3041791 RepID=UPI002783CEB9|nr:hypothetical protein [Microbacterium sp. SORGH_AS_0888]MDQ1129897.1 hypothetical protein [Microbacterium sp. SORGH_AS_0888]
MSLSVGYGGYVAGNLAHAANPLIEAPELPGWMDGVGPFQDGQAFGESLAAGDWVGMALSGGSIVLDVVDAVINPIATLVSLGAGWALEHLYPISDWLKQLTGDPHMVASFAGTWDNVSVAMSSASAQLTSTLSTLDGLEGFMIEAYERFIQTMVGSLAGASKLAEAMSLAMQLLASIVKLVHDLVRDVLADLVGFIVQAVVEAAATLGVAIPVIVAQLASKTAHWAALLSRFVKELVESAGTYVSLVSSLKETFEEIQKSLNEHFA